MLNTKFSPWPSFSEDEVEAVSQVLRSNRVNYWTGEECRAFENEFAQRMGANHAIALANGTVALDLALQGLGVGPGDEVIVSPRTFLASVSCVVNAGATPVFADVDRNSGNMTAETMAAVLSPRTKAAIPVHLAGWPCDMDSIMELSWRHGFKVIEDCAQAHGARWRGRAVGTIGHVGAWSFCQDKIITTGGEGGMVTTNDPDIWARMWAFKDHGKSWEAVYERQHPPGFRWLHDSFGTNWRMTELQGTIGRVQLAKLPAWTAARQANAGSIAAALAPFARDGGPIRLTPFNDPGVHTGPAGDRSSVHAYYKYYAYVEPSNLGRGWSRDRIVGEIVERGVPCYQGTCSEVYLERAFDGTGFRPAERCPIAKELGETSVMFLVHPTLKKSEMEKTAEVTAAVLDQASLG